MSLFGRRVSTWNSANPALSNYRGKQNIMIRPLRAEDLNQVVELWYCTSVLAHDFIPQEFWYSQKQAMHDIYLPNSNTWVYEQGDCILGFIAYYQGFIPALFVSPNTQSQGIGQQLLDRLKQLHNPLQLAVYAENQRAHQFYLKQGFQEIERRVCEHTQHDEIVMAWDVES